MAKQLKFGKEARELLVQGIDELSQAVSTTLGPKGRNVALDKKWGAPSVTHDGVTVAKEIELEDPFKNMGAQLLKEAASKTNDVAGDGTTTATVLAQAMVHAGLKAVEEGANPMILRSGIEQAANAVAEEIKNTAKKITTTEERAQVATNSAADSEIGQLIAESMAKVGADGVITVEEGQGLELTVDYKDGMEFDRGYVSPYFVTDAAKMTASIEDAYLLLTDKKISSMQDLLPFLESFVKVSKNLVIVAEDIDGEALATLVVNKLRGTFNVLAIKRPGFGDRAKEMLEDIAVLTGGSVISEDTGRTLESVQIQDLGQADRVTSDKDNTIIVGGRGDKAAVQSRIKQIKSQIETVTSDFDKEKLEERLAKLSGGVAVLKVGATTEIEMKEKKMRVEDAVHATKAAAEEGVVPGGGVALLRARSVLTKIKATGDEAKGVQIVADALVSPIKKIAANAGADPEQTLALVEKASGDHSYNALTGKVESMLRAGIVDPAKVTRSALLNAASVATMILTTEALITDIPKKEEPPAPGGMEY